VRPRSRIASIVFALALGNLTQARAQTSDVVVPALYSTTPMTRNAAVFFSAAVLSTSAVDRGLGALWLDRVRPDAAPARFARITRFVLFDIPVSAYFTGLNHEFGHLTRADERGLPRFFALRGGPWSRAPFHLVGGPGVFEDVASQVGGVEASRRLSDLAAGWMRDAERISPAHALAAINAAVDLPFYALRNLDAGEFEAFEPGLGAPLGDAAQFVRLIATQRDLDLHDVRTRVRRRSMVNFLDFSLWSLGFGLVNDHLWQGESGVRVRRLRVGALAFTPAVRYEWTPNGPEYQIATGYRAPNRSGVAYVRWSDDLADDRLVGVGYSLKRRAAIGISPEGRIDVWSQERAGRGVHAAVSGTLERWPARRARLTVTVGAKSRGYLPGFPLVRGAYVDAGLIVRPW
jgi:hypothetical protein